MILALSKILDLLVSPLAWAIGLALAAALLRRRPRAAGLSAFGAAAVLAVFSQATVANALFRWLEADARETFQPGPPYDAVIVLGGMVDASAARASGEVELMAAADRIVRAALLLRTGQARAVLLSGGEWTPVPGSPPEAERLAGLLRDLGVAPDRIVVEGASRNTRQNALESSKIVAARGWRRLLLVTSAVHVPRALGCFRAVGLEPDVLPVDHRGGDGLGVSLLPRTAALDGSYDALREATGRVVYRLLGWSR